ncbi:hypothetical protein AAVH_14110 [Aphelenchoides avenae]|nr:hypothetical protein AAVH_14110 [Aphelenchus avenae]
MEPHHKLQHLLQYLKGKPLEVATGFPLTAANYYIVVDRLAELYGNERRIRNLLLKDLFYTSASRILNILESLGDDRLSTNLKLDVLKDPDYQRARTASSVFTAIWNLAKTLEEAESTGLDLLRMQPKGRDASQPHGRATQPNRAQGPRHPNYTSLLPKPKTPRVQRLEASERSSAPTADNLTSPDRRPLEQCVPEQGGCPLQPLRLISPAPRLAVPRVHEPATKTSDGSSVQTEPRWWVGSPAVKPDESRQLARESTRSRRQTRALLECAQQSTGHSKVDRTKQSGKKKKNKNKGTPSSGRGGTYRPTTVSAAESIPQQDVLASIGTGLLPRHQCLLQTDRCPTQMTCPQFSDDFARRQYKDDQAWLVNLRAREVISSIDTLSRVSDGDIDNHGSEYDEGGEYPENSGYAVSTSSSADQQAVILECVKAIAVNRRTGASREVIVFFDSGSTASYVSTQLALALDLPQYEKRTLQINTFAATTTTTLEGFSTSLVLRSAKGRSISLDVAAADNIVRSNNCALISTRETPDLLIGQDLVHLFERRHEKRLPNGCYVVQTVLGHMVGGAGQLTTTVPKDTNTSTAADIAGGHGTLCQLPSHAPVDILGRSPSATHRGPQSASSMPGQNRLSIDPALAHSANNGVLTPEEPHSTFLCGLAEKTDAKVLGDFSYLENAGIGTAEMKPGDQTAADMLKTMHLREKDGCYKVPLLFGTATGAPPSNEELSTNAPLAKGRAISTRNSLLKAPQKLKNYDEIVKYCEKKEFIGKAPRFTPYPKHCLSHHPVFKETSTTTATRPFNPD